MDEYGNTRQFSVAEQQQYINGALALGASRADIDSFIANNGANDLFRINSALGLSTSSSPSTAPGPGTGTLSYSTAIASMPAEPQPAAVAATYATPTPIAAAQGLSLATAEDRRISGSSGETSLSVNVAGAAPTVLPASRPIPTWAILVGAAALIYAFRNHAPA